MHYLITTAEGDVVCTTAEGDVVWCRQKNQCDWGRNYQYERGGGEF